ncbi:MAG TPA: stage V sporulation protein T [Firmicutes bacterium]|nr:stage V sporulation protein T [Bacillota bacterium]
MKATGIVRRVDDLGRVIIPQKIRRTLRIREGDPLEIFVGHEDEVIFKKYSPIGQLGDFAKKYADALHETTGHISMIADRDVIIAVSEANQREYRGKNIGLAVEQALEERATLIMNELQPADDNVYVIQDGYSKYAIKSQVIAPIITQGDPIGAVIIVTKDAGVKLGDMEVKLAETAAGFLAKQINV